MAESWESGGLKGYLGDDDRIFGAAACECSEYSWLPGRKGKSEWVKRTGIDCRPFFWFLSYLIIIGTCAYPASNQFLESFWETLILLPVYQLV